MTPGAARHTRVVELFHSALEQPAEQRSAYLQQACQGDAALLADVQALLAADAQMQTTVSPGTMTPEIWQSIERLYRAMMLTDSDKRLAYLDSAGPHDPVIRQLLESMLCPAAYVNGFPNESWQWQWADGAQVGAFTIEKRVARDWTGQYYEARDPRSQQAVTLKAVRPEFAARLRDPNRTSAGLDHKGIVALREVSRHESVDFLVAELVTVVTLDARLSSGPLPLEDVLQTGIALCETLRYTHQNGVVHRELSPKTILPFPPA